MPKLKLKAEKRTIFGRKIKKLRREGILPANIYGKDVKSQAVEIKLADFWPVYKEAGETGIVELTVAKEKKMRPVLIHNLQQDSVSDEPLHADFHQVDLKEKVQVNIPIELLGEAPAVSKGGVLVQQLDEVLVEALPTDLPEKFEVDITKIEEVGQSISLKDLKVDRTKIKVLVEDENQLVVKVEEPKKEEEKPAEAISAEGEAPAAEGGAAAEAEAGKEAKPEEGKKPSKEEGKPEVKPGEEKK